MQAWTQAQNALTRRVLDAVPGRDAIRGRVAELLGVGWLMPPVVRKGRYFYTRREGAEDQLILRWRSADGGDRVLIDPVAQTGIASTAIDWWFPSPDGRLVAYGLSRGGDEQSTLRVRGVDDGKDLAEEIPRTRFCSLAWLPDASAFYYTRFPPPGTVPAGDEEYGRRVFLHRLGTDWRADVEVFGEGRPKEHMAWLGISPDGRWLWVGSWHSSSRNDLYLLDRAAPERGFVTIMEGVAARAVPDAQADALWVFTNLGAPRYRVCRIDPVRPQPEYWTEVIPEGRDTIQNAGVVGGHLGCLLLRDASSALRLHRLDGTPVREVALPGPGTVYYWTGEADQDEIFVAYQSFVQPPTVYRHVVSTGEQAVWAQVDSPVDPATLEIRQVWFASKDGTRVSMLKPP